MMASGDQRFPLLLRRCRVLPQESLPSLLVRLAQLNYYQPVTTLRQLCLAGLEPDRLDWPARGDIFDRLFDLVWLDPYRLHDATGHYFAETLTPPGRQIEDLPRIRGGRMLALAPEIAQEQLRPELAAQFCPICLRRTIYHRVAWLPVAVSACITHKRLLVDRCPNCQATLSIQAIVEACCCHRCGADLQRAPAVRLHDDNFGLFAQRFIHGWLRVGRFPPRTSQNEWLRCHPSLLFCLVDGLVAGLKAISSDWDYLHQPLIRSPLTSFGSIRDRPTPEQSYRLYTTAFKILLDWPHGFYEFLHAYTQRNGQLKRGIAEDLGKLGTQWFNDRWDQPEFRFVQDALAHYLVDTYVAPSPPPLSGNPPASTFVSLIRAARLLEVSIRTLERLVKIGLLVKYNSEHGLPHKYGAIRRDELLRLRLAWRKPISLEDAAKWLGLTKTIVIDLVRVGLLTAESQPDDMGAGDWLFSKQSLDQCYTVLAKHVRNGFEHSSLAKTAKTLSVIGLKVADILKLVAQGELYCCSSTKASNLANIYFDCYEIDALLENPAYGKGFLTSGHAADRLNVDQSTFSDWRIDGLFSPVLQYAHEYFFDPDDIDNFLANHITSQEAAKLLNANLAELEGWYWAWGLKAAKGIGLDGQPVCLFYRKAVKRVAAIEARQNGQNKKFL